MPGCPGSVITIKPKGKKSFCTATILALSFMKIRELVYMFKCGHTDSTAVMSVWVISHQI
jgi:hypothetical protein